MLLHIPEVLTKEQVAALRRTLDSGTWLDGAATAGPLAAEAKRNMQFSTESADYPALSQAIISALERHPLFISAALPHTILPPMFNRYAGGGLYGNHVDNAIQTDRRNGQRVRTDISVTVFLSEPESYEGGDLIIEDTYGSHEVKLPAGDAIIYPSSSLHRVEPVTAGERVASFTWVQSLVRDDWQRSMLFNLDMTLIKLRSQIGNTDEIVDLTGHYHNLLRQWGS
ncbi:MAG TPA: Fe2+-dependent dioxygenase [Methylophilaceae bacterium]|nr:Fe2+-dependent dioxygenase [Methylophilaceae bacterium]